MFVSQYLEFVTSSEVKPLAVSDIGGSNPNSIQKENISKLISYLNLANIEVHKIFALIQKEFLLEAVLHNKMYDLPTDFLCAMSAAYNDGTPLSMNNDRTLFTDNVDVGISVMFPEPFKALTKGTDPSGRNIISLTYVASPPQVSKTTDFIDISHAFTDAIINYIAYKAYASMQGEIQATNNTFYLRFIESCRSIKENGLVTVDNLDSNTKLTDAGFV